MTVQADCESDHYYGSYGHFFILMSCKSIEKRVTSKCSICCMFVVSVDINKQIYAHILSIMLYKSNKTTQKTSKNAIYMKGCFVVASIHTVYSYSKAFVCTKQLSIKLCELTKHTVALNYIVYFDSNYLNNFE